MGRAADPSPQGSSSPRAPCGYHSVHTYNEASRVGQRGVISFNRLRIGQRGDPAALRCAQGAGLYPARGDD
jgi:hypothetical protein